MIHLIFLKKRIEGIDGIGEVLVFATKMKTEFLFLFMFSTTRELTAAGSNKFRQLTAEGHLSNLLVFFSPIKYVNGNFLERISALWPELTCCRAILFWPEKIIAYFIW